MSELPRLLESVRADDRPVPLAEHVGRYGAAELPRDLVETVRAAGLTGRGGAGFPTATKLDAVRAGRGRPVVVANGAEGEPASGKDKVLLAYVPHLVLDGAALAARAVGARSVLVAVTRAVASRVAGAVRERRDRDLRFELAVVPDRFVTGEETALVNVLNGGPALPTFTPPRPFERGIRGAPTLVLNVETLAHVALIARNGASWFRNVGTAAEPGSVLVTVSGAVAQPGVYEVALGSPISTLLGQAGGLTHELGALLVGGYFGTWLGASDAADAVLSNAGLSRYRVSMGARAIVALPRTTCGVAETARIARYLAHESAGQCGPCVHGLNAVAGSLDMLVRSDRRAADTGLLRRRLAQIAGRGACHHPNGAVGLVSSALRVFADEFERHAHGRRCTASHDALVPIPALAAEAR